MGQMLELGSALALHFRKTFSVRMSEGSILWTALLAVSVLLLGICLQAIHRKNLPPGPWGLPILGSIFSLGPLPYKSLRKLALKHGEFMYLRMGSIPCVVVSSSAMAKEIVTKHDLEFADRPIKLFNKILYEQKDIVTAPYGPAWRHLRMICTSQFFTKKRISSFESGRAEEIHSLTRLILRKASSDEDDVVNLPFQLRNTNTNIISRMMFNKRLFGDGEECNAEDAKGYQEILSLHFSSYAIFVVGDYIPSLRFITNLEGIPEKMQKVADRIYKKIDEIIDFDEHEKWRLNQNHEPGAADREQDFVDLLLSTPSHDGSGTLNHEIIRAVVMNMLFAGAETQSTTMEWAMAQLLRHPDVMQRAQAELDDVVGAQRLVQEADLEQLPYLEAVIKEVMRVHPGAPLSVNHESREPCRVAGYNLPAKTRLFFNVHSILRDPSIYDRPNEFDPSRFLKPQAGDHDSSFQFMPFGAGRRICPGMPLATTNMPHLLAHLLHSFDWRLPGGQNPQDLDMLETFDGVTTHRLHPLLTLAKPRKPAFLY